MSSFGPMSTYTAKAAADLRTKQYHVMRYSAEAQVNQASHAAATIVNGPIGVLQNKPNSGQAATIAYFGESTVVAGGALTANTLITTNGSGRIAAAVSGDITFGRVMEAASQDGDHVRVLIFPPYPLLRT